MPSPSPSSPPRTRRRTERRQPGPAVAAPATAARDWAGLPRDAVATVLAKLPVGDALGGAGGACRPWRRAAAEEPALWRRAAARWGPGLAAARRAAWRSRSAGDGAGRGGCEEFEAERVADDRVLLYLADWLSCLKSLCLISCFSVSNEGFVEAIKGLPLLEKLQLSLCKNIFGEAIVVAGKACPQLKCFRLSNDRFYCFDIEDEYNNDLEARGISTMCELRSLQLFGNNITNKGLTSILDNCPYLESLDIRHCFNVNMDAALQAKCARIKTLRSPGDITDDYEFEVKSPVRYNSNPNSIHYGNDYYNSTHDPSEDDEDFLDDYDAYPIDDVDINEEYDEPLLRMAEPGEIPEDEEAMMLDHYALLYEEGLLGQKPDGDGGGMI